MNKDEDDEDEDEDEDIIRLRGEHGAEAATARYYRPRSGG